MGTLYTWAFYLLMPVILARLWWRGRKLPAYRQRWRERLGFYPPGQRQGVIWFHAVSVGEAETLFPLVRRLRQDRPQLPILVTTTTPTGSARVQAVLKNAVSHVYLPYDLPDVLHRFTRCFQPHLAVIMETEIWPNLYAHCGQQNIPLLMLNACLSARSVRGYQRLASLIRPALANVNLLAVQSPEEAAKFLAIGASAKQIQILGNLKFAVALDEDIRTKGLALKSGLFAGRFVCLLASTHAGEEAALLPELQKLRLQMPELMIVIAPRHPERAGEIQQLCAQAGLTTASRTAEGLVTPHTPVYLVDTLGELKSFYVAADVAFVGGSLVPIGGHNVLEAAAAQVPILFGPETANITPLTDALLANDAAVRCPTANAVAETVLTLHQNPVRRAELARHAAEFIAANQGAMARILAALNPYLPPD